MTLLVFIPHYGVSTLAKTDKNGLCRIVWRYSYCSETETDANFHGVCTRYRSRCRAVWMNHHADGMLDVCTYVDEATQPWRRWWNIVKKLYKRSNPPNFITCHIQCIIWKTSINQVTKLRTVFHMSFANLELAGTHDHKLMLTDSSSSSDWFPLQIREKPEEFIMINQPFVKFPPDIFLKNSFWQFLIDCKNHKIDISVFVICPYLHVCLLNDYRV